MRAGNCHAPEAREYAQMRRFVRDLQCMAIAGLSTLPNVGHGHRGYARAVQIRITHSPVQHSLSASHCCPVMPHPTEASY